MNDRPTESEATNSPQIVTFDAILPRAMAVRAEDSGVRRAASDPMTIIVLSVLGGAFVAFGAIFATTVSAGSIAVSAADGSAALEAIGVRSVVTSRRSRAADLISSTAHPDCALSGPGAGSTVNS
jgi:hypothetical protein